MSFPARHVEHEVENHAVFGVQVCAHHVVTHVGGRWVNALGHVGKVGELAEWEGIANLNTAMQHSAAAGFQEKGFG